MKELYSKFSTLPNTETMPILFVGHGSPMNAIEQNEFTHVWSDMNKILPPPSAIICISAHWETRGTYVTANEKPETIHDFYDFPNELYQQEYPAPGSPELTQKIISSVKHPIIGKSYEWGLDHGTWSVLKYIYPNANIPTIQISIDQTKNTQWHYELGAKLSFLRTKGVLIVGSGNMVHNLRSISLQGDNFNAEYGYEWAFRLNDIFKNKIIEGDHESLIKYQYLDKDVNLAIPTPEHYIPLLYVLGMRKENENINVFNDKVIAGSLSMTSVLIGNS